MRCRPFFSLMALAGALSCAHDPPPASPSPPIGLTSPFTGFTSAHYADPKAWLCLPGREDACASNLNATSIAPDGTRAVVQGVKSEAANDVDCFYVYPTVNLSLGPANHTSFEDLEPMTHATVAQAASFRRTCRLFVPLYRQATIGSYLRRADEREEYLKVAASDVVDAFLHYMGAFNGGRRIVLIGHSQGAEMITRLLKRYFDDDPKMRERLLLAMPIGGHLEVAKGATTGGTFTNIPVCTREGETGCVVGYRSYLAGVDVDAGADAPAPGFESVCVNPAELDAGHPRPFSNAFLPSVSRAHPSMQRVEGVTTPFLMFRDFYQGRCESHADGFRYLAVNEVHAAGDSRVGPIDLSSRWLRGKLGLHVLDFQLAQGNLVDLVARRAQHAKHDEPTSEPPH